MSEKHPGVGHPETSSMEPGNRTPGSMTGAEIGIVVTTVICFIFMIATLLWCRHRRVKDALRRAEEGEVEGQEKHQSQQKDDGHTQGQEDAPGSGQKQSKGRHWWGFLTKPSDSTQAREPGQGHQGASENEACQGKKGINTISVQGPESNWVIRGCSG